MEREKTACLPSSDVVILMSRLEPCIHAELPITPVERQRNHGMISKAGLGFRLSPLGLSVPALGHAGAKSNHIFQNGSFQIRALQDDASKICRCQIGLSKIGFCQICIF
jgi:hypothetical protein